jgi:hypothetical protein
MIKKCVIQYFDYKIIFLNCVIKMIGFSILIKLNLVSMIILSLDYNIDFV